MRATADEAVAALQVAEGAADLEPQVVEVRQLDPGGRFVEQG
jgi:hypothetical protein